MKKQKLEFADHETQEERQLWWDKELECVKFSYPIPCYNISPALEYHPKWIREGEKPKNCVDIGANVGCFSHYAAPHFENVYAFEAVNNTYKVACENLKNDMNVQIYNLAAYKESNHEISIFAPETALSRDSSIYTLHGGSIYTSDDSNTYELTKTISLEHIFGLCNIDMIDYLKVDCEGAEYDLLMNKDLSRINFMVVEFHPGFLGKEKMKELIMHIKKFFNLQFMLGHWIGFYEKKVDDVT